MVDQQQNIVKAIQGELISDDEDSEHDSIINHVNDSLSGALGVVQATINSSSRPSPLIYELIQNADDADAENVFVFLKETPDSNKLFFVHDGNKFTDKDVISLCSIGQSNKSPEEGTIGYFGIGFKSVFLASEQVEVKSGDYHFSFRKNNKNNLEKNEKNNLWMICPKEPKSNMNILGEEDLDLKHNKFLYDNVHKTKDELTFIALRDIPKNKFEEVQRALLSNDDSDDGWDLKPRPTLFLNSLEKIQIVKWNSKTGGDWKEERKIKKDKKDENLKFVEFINKESKIYELSDSNKDYKQKWLLIEDEIHLSTLFSLFRAEYEEYLKEGTIDSELKYAFEDEDYEVDEDAELAEEDGKWFISEEGEKKYRIEVDEDELNIYENSIDESLKKIAEIEETSDKRSLEQQLEDEKNLHKREDVETSSVKVGFKIKDGKLAKAEGALASAFYSGAQGNQFESGLKYLISADFLFSTSRDSIDENSVWNKIMAIKISDLLVDLTGNLSEAYQGEVIEKWNKDFGKKETITTIEDLEENKKNINYNFTNLFSIISNPKLKRWISNKNKKFFNRYISNPFKKKIKEKEVFPSFNPSKNKITLAKPKNTYYFWPKDSCLCKGKNNRTPFEKSRLFNEIQNFVSLQDIKTIYDYYDNHKEEIKKFSKILSKVHEDADETLSNCEGFWEKIISKNFVVPNFLTEYADKHEKVSKRRNKQDNIKKNITKKIKNLFSGPDDSEETKELFEKHLDILYLIHDNKIFLKNKLGRKKKNTEWLLKFYAYLNHINLPRFINHNEKEGKLRRCLEIFFDEEENLRRLGGCNIKNNLDCPYSCDQSVKKDKIYRAPSDIKTEVESISDKDIRFLNPEFDKYKKYLDKNYHSKNKIQADLGNYYRNFGNFLENYDINVAPQEDIIYSLIDIYSGDKCDVSDEDNIRHLKLLIELKDKLIKKQIDKIKSLKENECLIKLMNKKKNYRRPSKLLYDDYHFDKFKDILSDDATINKIKKHYTLKKYVYHDEIGISKKDIGLEDFSFLDKFYLKKIKPNNYEDMTELLEILNFGDLNIKSKDQGGFGDIGEELAKLYYEKENKNKKIIRTEKIDQNFAGYDLAILDSDDSIPENDKEEWLRGKNVKKIEVKFTKNDVGGNVRVSYKQAKKLRQLITKKHQFDLDYSKYEGSLEKETFSQKLRKAFKEKDKEVDKEANLIKGGNGKWFIYENNKKIYMMKREKEKLKIYDPPEDGRFFLTIIYNGFDFDDLKLVEYDGKKINLSGIFNEEAKLNFRDEFGKPDREKEISDLIADN